MHDSARIVPILMYHRIGRPDRRSIVASHYVSQSLLGRHVRTVRRLGYRSSPLRQVVEFFKGSLEPPTKPIVLTFDDAYESVFRTAIPVLNGLETTATVFVVAGQVGGTNEWDVAKGDVVEPLMTADQIREADRQGYEIGSHSLSHPDLTAIPLESAGREISESKSILQDIVQSPVEWFCYPFGAHNEAVRGLVRAAGFGGACATGKFGNTADTDVYALKRLNVRATTSSLQLALKLIRARRTPG